MEMKNNKSQIATLDAHTLQPSHHNTMEKFAVAILLQTLQFIVNIQYISVVIRKHRIVKIRSTSTTQYSAYTSEK